MKEIKTDANGELQANIQSNKENCEKHFIIEEVNVKDDSILFKQEKGAKDRIDIKN